MAKTKFTVPISELEDVYFTWGIVSDAARYAKVVNKLEKYVAVHFWDQATVAVRALGEFKPPAFVKLDYPVRVYWSDEVQTLETSNKHNAGSTPDTVPKSEDWEHKLEVDEYFKKYKARKDGTKT